MSGLAGRVSFIVKVSRGEGAPTDGRDYSAGSLAPAVGRGTPTVAPFCRSPGTNYSKKGYQPFIVGIYYSLNG